MSRLYILGLCMRLLASIYDFYIEHKDRYILAVPVFIAFGIGLYFSLDTEILPIYGVMAFTVLACGCVLTYRYVFDSKMVFIFYIHLWMIFLILTGFLAAQFRTYNVSAPILNKKIKFSAVSGVIENIEIMEQGRSYRVVISDPFIEKLSRSNMPARIRIKFHDIGNAVVGDRVEFNASIAPPSPPVLPSGFDFQFYAFFKQLGGFGFAYGPPEVIEHDSERRPLRIFSAIRAYISARILSYYPDASAASVLIALMTGDKSVIAEHDLEAMRKAGLAHVLAISGLHIGMVSGFIFFVTRALFALSERWTLKYPIKKFAAFVAILGALIYVFIAGAGIPAVRALIMSVIFFAAIMVDRTAISMRLVAVAALMVLLLFPESLKSASFQMSFAAVAGLVYFYQITRIYWIDLYRGSGLMRRLCVYYMALIATTIVASIATAPFIAFHFQQLPLHNSLVANLIAMPLMSIIVMPCIVIAFVMMPFSAEGPLTFIAIKALEIIITMAHDVSSWQGSVWYPSAMPQTALICITFAAISIIILRRYKCYVATLCLCAAAVFISQAKPADILVAGSGGLIAVHDEKKDILWLSTRLRERFASDRWQEAFGYAEHQPRLWNDHEWDNERSDMNISCGEFSCHINMKDHLVAASSHASSLKDDCALADIVITDYPVASKQCEEAIVIDRYDLYHKGSYAIYLNEQTKKINMDYVSAHRGKRPWIGRHSE